MKIHNTLGGKLDKVPTDKVVNIYTCGPTVYLDPHIGNWRTFILYDTLVRSIVALGGKVNHVMNITDVGHLVSDEDDGEDKLQKQAAKERKTAQEIAKQYEASFIAGMKQLNMKPPSALPRATEHIEEQIALVRKLEEKGYAYSIDDGVYFDTGKLRDYGKLQAGNNEDDGVGRINSNDQKKSPRDFALWKFSPKDATRDMEWESPWGIGFPGWHIECSAMAQKYLGDTLDIHAGGIDHIPVHHTNEIAQSEAANDVEFSRIWMHGEFMKVDGQKMSKSIGNVYTLSDITSRQLDPIAFRLLVLQGHYRTESNFSFDNITAARTRLGRLRQMAERRWQPIPDEDSQQARLISEHHKEYLKALSNDLKTPEALKTVSAVSDLVSDGVADVALRAFNDFLLLIDGTLGLDLCEDTPDKTNDIEEHLASRAEARKEKDFSKSDGVRDLLANEYSVEVLDTPAGQLWQTIDSAPSTREVKLFKTV